MQNIYSQLTVQLVLAVRHRQSLIQTSFKQELYTYMTGLFRANDQKLLAINGMPDHLHILFLMNPDLRLSRFVRDIKHDSSLFINERRLVRRRFHWQMGFGAFSYSFTQRDTVINYIHDQEELHKQKTFREEYHDFLCAFNVAYDAKEMFDFFD